MEKIFINWHGVSIPLPNHGWRNAEGSSLDEKQKRAIEKGSIVRVKSPGKVKFFAKNRGGLMSCTMLVHELDKLAQGAQG